ncbi:hypothetical protein HDR61_02130 [bacterium]|nr:hypothetical protein [bacterium]
MKKFDRKVHKTMGSIPPALMPRIADMDAATATTVFNDAITKIARDFHAALVADKRPEDIKLMSAEIFGMPVTLDYIASGSVGSVYKIQIGDRVFALKINRNSSTGELGVMPRQSRARNLVNKMYMGAMFEHNGRKYSWVLSDYIAHDRENSFARAMEKLFYAYLTKGVNIVDAHSNNFIDGKLIDQASFTNRTGKIDDIKKLSRVEVDKVKKLVYYIKTDNVPEFQKLITKLAKTNPAVVNYMFFAMKFGKSPIFGPGKTDPFSVKIRKFESIVNDVRRDGIAQNATMLKSDTSRGI